MAIKNSRSPGNWFPDKEDKFLPVWVIAVMSISVLGVSCSMVTTIKEVCAIKPSPCYAAKPEVSSQDVVNAQSIADFQKKLKEEAESKLQAAKDIATETKADDKVKSQK
jgi:hypothetical protein